MHRAQMDHREDHCQHCGARRTAHVDRATGRYDVTLASACPDQDRCEREIMAGFDVEPVQRERAAEAAADSRKNSRTAPPKPRKRLKKQLGMADWPTSF